MSIGVTVHAAKRPVRIPVRFKEWALDFLCAYVLTMALAVALFDVVGLAVGRWALAGIALAAMVLVFALSRKWWVLPAALLLVALYVGGLWIFDKGFADKVSYLSSLVNWVVAGMPQREPYSFDLSLMAVQLLAMIPIAAISYLFIRKLFSFIALAVVAFGLAIALFMMESTALDTALLLLLAAAVMTLPRIAGRQAYRSDAPRADGAQDHQGEVTRFSMQALAIPAAALCVALAIYAAPANPAEWRSPFVASLVSDITDLYDFYFSDMHTEGGYNSIARSGFLPLGSRLGGDIEPTRDRVLYVYTETPMPIRGSVSDTYNGEMWYDGWKNGRFRFGSVFWRSRRIEAFTEGLPSGGKEAMALYEQMTDEVQMRVSYLRYNLSDLFTVGDVQSMEFNTRERPAVYFNLQSEMYLGSVLNPYEGYTFTSTYLNRGKTGFQDNMLALEALTLGLPDAYYEDIYNKNTYLPETISQSVYDLAQQITRNAASPYEKAVAIEMWLHENCTYTMAPGSVPVGTDFVEYFLETREGYCVYYASAMSVLARCVGIPSRYVTGYGLNYDPDTRGFEQNRYTATNLSAHAWSELYFQGIGWLSFDPLGYDNAVLAPDAVPEPVGPQGGASGELESEEELEEDFIPGDMSILEGIGRQNKAPVWPWAVGGVAALLIALLVLWRFWSTRYFAGYALERVSKRNPTMRARVDCYYSDIIRQLRFWGLVVQPGDTVITVAEQAKRIARVEGVRFDHIAGIVMRQRYGGVDADEEELRSLYFSHDAIEEHLREALGKGRYALQRGLGLFWLREQSQ